MSKRIGRVIKVDLETLGDTIARFLPNIDDLDAQLNLILEEIAGSLANRLRRESPRDTGEYAAGWTSTTEFRPWQVQVVRNEAKPTLTHLLEYGRKGGIGLRPHIWKAYDAELAEIDKYIDNFWRAYEEMMDAQG